MILLCVMTKQRSSMLKLNARVSLGSTTSQWVELIFWICCAHCKSTNFEARDALLTSFTILILC